MTKRYREALTEVLVSPSGGEGGDVPPSGAPLGFAWRGHTFKVRQVLGHWREDPGWWRKADGSTVRIEQSDLWRVEATQVMAGPTFSGEPRGVYELVQQAGAWRLDRVWD